MSRIAAIGTERFVAAFACVGAELYPCESVQAFEQTLSQLRRHEDLGLVLAEETLAADAVAAINDFREASSAVFTALQSTVSDAHNELDRMRRLIEKSTGANLLGEY